jgi:hypothetical protein
VFLSGKPGPLFSWFTQLFLPLQTKIKKLISRKKINPTVPRSVFGVRCGKVLLSFLLGIIP